jgi:hypothetical protein
MTAARWRFAVERRTLLDTDSGYNAALSAKPVRQRLAPPRVTLHGRRISKR